jgi:hypothetical protein
MSEQKKSETIIRQRIFFSVQIRRFSPWANAHGVFEE